MAAESDRDTGATEFRSGCEDYILEEAALGIEDAKDLAQYMLNVRYADQKQTNIAKGAHDSRFDKRGSNASSKGHEAIQVGMAAALEMGENGNDWYVPYYRDHGQIYTLLREHGYQGDLAFAEQNGIYQEFPEDINILPKNIPIASQYPQAQGIAHAMKCKGDTGFVVVNGGDGSTSEGDFYEALNFAGVFETPLMIAVTNNQLAISTAAEDQTITDTFAEKALAAGLEGVQIDGNDVFQVYGLTRAVRMRTQIDPADLTVQNDPLRAYLRCQDPDSYRFYTPLSDDHRTSVEHIEEYAGTVPQDIAVKNSTLGDESVLPAVLVEMKTGRYEPHTQSDDPKRYLDPEKRAEWEHDEPLKRFKTDSISEGWMTEQEWASMEREASKEAKNLQDRNKRRFEELRKNPETIFEHVYDTLTAESEDQREQFRRVPEPDVDG